MFQISITGRASKNLYNLPKESLLVLHDNLHDKVLICGPWWVSSGQRARLLLRQSEFESRWSLQFFCKIEFKKNENKQKEAQRWPIFVKKGTYLLFKFVMIYLHSIIYNEHDR